MKTLSWTIKCLLPGFVFFFAVATCRAGSIELTPVRLDLSAAAKVAVLTVRNTGDEDTVMQVTLNKWTLDGQRYVYEPSQELIVTPVTFQLAPGKKQIIRIGLRSNPPADKEDAFRLLVEEVPPPPSADVTQTRLVVRHDLPVFIAPAVKARPAIDVSIGCEDDGTKLRLTNIGNVHQKLRDVVLEDVATNQELAHLDTFDYLLPAAQRAWNLRQVAPNFNGKSLLVTMHTEQDSFTSNVTNTCR